MKKLLPLFLFFLLCLNAQAQKSTVNGKVIDSLSGNALHFATVSLVKAKDSSLIAFTQSDTLGRFQFKNIGYGNYLISCSYAGHAPVWKPVHVNDKAMDLLVPMTSEKMLENVTIAARRPPVVFNNDTLEFNTENFKTQPNAVVEELLKRFPGVSIDSDGTVRMNGRVINRILVNGKEFFSGDPKMATRNLAADMVDKVQVFEKASELAELTGFDDGKSETTMNLKLKKDRNKAFFGKGTAGAGVPGRYEAHTNMNRFGDGQQLSLIGMASNTNKQGFSAYDILSFTGELADRMKSSKGGGISITTGSENNLPLTDRGANQQGISNTLLGGVNFNDSWNNGKWDVNGNFISSNVALTTVKQVKRNYLYPGNNYTYQQQVNSISELAQKRLGLTIDHRIDSAHSIKLTSRFGRQHLKNQIENDYTSEGAALLNEGHGLDNASGETLSGVLNLLFRKKFKRRGRTISWRSDMVANSNKTDGITDNFFTIYTGSTSVDSILNQQRLQHNQRNSWSTGITYTEPIGKRSLLELTATVNEDRSAAKRDVYDYSADSLKYNRLNRSLSNHYEATYSYVGRTVGFRSNIRKLSIGMEATWQTALLKGRNFSAEKSLRTIFHDILPGISIQAKTRRGASVNLNYTASTHQPTVQQLQPVPDVSNPLNIIYGNPELKPSYQHSVNLQYLSVKTGGRSLFAFTSFTRTNRSIAYIDELLPGAIREARPVNVNGVMNIYGNATLGFPIRSINSRVDIGVGASWNRGFSFVSGQKNEIMNANISPLVKWRYALDQKLELMASGRVYFYQVKYSLVSRLNNSYHQQIYNTEVNWYAPFGIVANTNVSYTKNTGRADGFNSSITLWNTSVAYAFLASKKLEIKLSIYNILNTNLGIKRTATPTYLEDVRYNVLGRFTMLTCTYSFTRLLNKKQ